MCIRDSVDAVQLGTAQLWAPQRLQLVALQLEVGLGDTDDPTLEVAAGNPHRGQPPPGEDEDHAAGQVVGQRVEQLDGSGVLDDLDVIEQEDQVQTVQGGQQPRHEHPWPVRLRGADVAEHGRHGRQVLGEPLDEMAPELLDAVVKGLQRDDHRRAARGAGPGVEQGALPVSSRRNQRDDAPPRDILETREQPRPRHQALSLIHI